MPRFLRFLLVTSAFLFAACVHDDGPVAVIAPPFDLLELGYCFDPVVEEPDFWTIRFDESTPELVLDEDLGDVLEPVEPVELVRPVEMPWYLATRETQRNT
jgi:hypothetical protein